MVMSAQLTSGQAARVLDVSDVTVRKWADEGRLSAVVTPLGRLLDADSVLTLAAERTAREQRRLAGVTE